MSMCLPWRRWLAEPDGDVTATDRASIGLKICSSIDPSAPTSGGGGGGIFRSSIIQGSFYG